MNGICIIPNKDDCVNIDVLYNKLEKMYKNVFILEPEVLVCPLKFTDNFLYVNLAKTCEHENTKFVNETKHEKIIEMIEEYYKKRDGIVDDILTVKTNAKTIVKNEIENNNSEDDKMAISDKKLRSESNNNTDTDNAKNNENKNNTQSNNKTINDNINLDKNYESKYDTTNIENDKMTFLIKRLAQIEKIKNKTIFTIFFTLPFHSLAKKVKNYLHTKDKLAYLVYLNDFTYERLTCIDNTEVVVDCQDHYGVGLLVPLVTPFDILLAFDLCYKWNGEYNKNYFEVTQDQIVKTENSIELLNKKLESIELVSVNITKEESDDEIYEGRRGIASEYEFEGI
ncbi:hypothetical protein BDAP_000942 [Binucleata daphniae]